jgi:hypothetical protein
VKRWLARQQPHKQAERLATSEFESSWPDGVPLQIHMMDADAWTEDDRVSLYPGSGHLFAESKGLLAPGDHL